MRNLPHVKQPVNLRNCGACCLQMLFQAYGLESTVDHIWSDISDLGHCRNMLMLKYLKDKGLQAAIVSVNDLIAVLDICLTNGIEVILNHRLKKDSYYGHYSLYSYQDEKQIYVNDPRDDKPNTAIKIYKLNDLMKKTPGLEIVQDNTLLLINFKETLPTISIPHNGHTVEFFECIVPYVNKVLCHQCPEYSNCWHNYSPNAIDIG